MPRTSFTEWFARGVFACFVVASAAHLVATSSVLGAEADATEEIHEFRSANFIVHTDLDESSAKAFLTRMESTLRVASAYWGRGLKGQIECYLVDKVQQWPPKSFPEQHARILLERVGGGTVIEGKRINQRFVAQSCIYATTQPGVVEHEVIHAYCFQAFGKGGPDWYREGMAELFAMNAELEIGAKCREKTLRLLSEGEPLSLRRILTRTGFTDAISEMISRGSADERPIEFDLAVSERQDSRETRQLKQAHVAYAECWALCYLLHHNPNYERRFRLLGRRFLSDPDARFEDLFQPMMQNIDFELKQLGRNIGEGYRADLCRWPWSMSFSAVGVGRSVTVQLKACAGYQATRLQVKSGQEYQIHAIGKWQVSRNHSRVGADGNRKGRGQLEAIVLDGFQLNDPQILGSKSTFHSADSGKLYLRCHDDWLNLADNRGIIQVRLKRTK